MPNEITPAASLDGREEFEKYARSEGNGDYQLRTAPNGDYLDFMVQARWHAWQASRASDRERVAELERAWQFEIKQADDRTAAECEAKEAFQHERDGYYDDWRAAESRVEQLQRQLSELTELLRTMEKELAMIQGYGESCLRAKCLCGSAPAIRKRVMSLLAALRSHIEGK